MASETEQEALKADIKENGQQLPILLWQNKIVDGRCRQEACQDLDLELNIKELPWNTTYEEVASIVKSLNTRRNLTFTQKVMSACIVSLDKRNKSNIEEISKSWGVGSQATKNARYITKHKPKWAKILFEGGAITGLMDKNGKEMTTSTVSAVCAAIKRYEEVGEVGHQVKTVFQDWNPKAQVKTQLGKDQLGIIKEGVGELSPLLMLHLIDLINDSRTYGPKVEEKDKITESIPFNVDQLAQLDKQAVSVFYKFLKVGMNEGIKRSIFEYCLTLNGLDKLPANIIIS